MSSAAAFPGLPNYAAYSAARAGVNGLTKAVGREAARDGIQVNAIAQNYVENPTYFPPTLTGDPEKLSRMSLSLPKAASGEPRQDRVSVSVTRDGVIYLDRDRVEPAQLTEKLRALHEEDPEVVVVVSADGDVTHRHVVEAMGGLGITNV